MQRLMILVLLAACSGGERPPITVDATTHDDAVTRDPWTESVYRLVAATCYDDCSMEGPKPCESNLTAEMAMARTKLGPAKEAQCIACMDELAKAAASRNQPQCFPMGDFDIAKCDYDLNADTNGSGIAVDDLDACAHHPRPPSS